MKEQRKNIFHWNHISNKLTEEQIEELKAYYQSYHKKCFAYKLATKRLKNGNYWEIHYPSYLHLEVLLPV